MIGNSRPTELEFSTWVMTCFAEERRQRRLREAKRALSTADLSKQIRLSQRFHHAILQFGLIKSISFLGMNRDVHRTDMSARFAIAFHAANS
jgi:hypothetical protein